MQMKIVFQDNAQQQDIIEQLRGIAYEMQYETGIPIVNYLLRDRQGTKIGMVYVEGLQESH